VVWPARPCDPMRTTSGRLRYTTAVVLLLACVGAARASDWLPPYVVGGQVTVVWQHQPAFRSPYQGPHSLRPRAEDAVSHSYTLYTGLRLLPWLDLYVDPEMIRGDGISGGVGLAGYTNGEVIRNPEAGQSPYLARAFLRATIALAGPSEDQERDLLQVGGPVSARRLVLTGGRAGGCRHLRHQPLREQHPDAVPQLVLH